jgi:hypothetical protein
MEDKSDKKKFFDSKHGITLNWDNAGNCFISMPVNNIPKKQFEDWIKVCRDNYSGKRWDMITADHMKAKAYDALMMTIPDKDDIPVEENINQLGLLNPDMVDVEEK